MNQIAIDFNAARQRANVGMQRAADAADRLHSDWSESAFLFLKDYARTHQTFIGEDVSDAHISAGLPQPRDLRAWGGLYQRAQKAGIIVHAGFGKSRRRCSETKRYASQIYGMADHA